MTGPARHTRRSRWHLIAVVTALVLTVTAFAPTAPAGASVAAAAKTKPRKVSPLRGTINVSAAASLTEAFQSVAKVFRFLAPNVTINLSFAGSQALVSQVQQGAPVDVIATADEASMRKLSAADLLATDTFLFARNRLAILTANGNPRNVQQLSDLARPDVSVALCAAAVPCGKFSNQILANAGVTLTPKTLEDNVKGVVIKVAAGEVDAGIAYVTDAIAARDGTDAVRIPDENNVINAYPIAVPRTAANDYLGRVFILFLFSQLGQNILALHGFMRA